MKKAIIIITVFIMVLSALCEDRPDGSTYDMYRAVWTEGAQSGWEIMSYIDSEGLLMTAYNETAEITVSLEEPLTLQARLDGMGRYAEILSFSGDDELCIYTYRLKSGTVCETGVCQKEAEGKKFTISMTAWTAGDASRLFKGICSGITIEKAAASPEYIALLTGCEEKNGSIWLQLDFVTLEYDNLYGGAVFMNEDMTRYSYALQENALIYLPDINDTVYSMHSSAADAAAIQYMINEYRGINGQDGLYFVRFNENNSIIRVQHYNAL